MAAAGLFGLIQMVSKLEASLERIDFRDKDEAEGADSKWTVERGDTEIVEEGRDTNDGREVERWSTCNISA
jgi:hypothetical protein